MNSSRRLQNFKQEFNSLQSDVAFLVDKVIEVRGLVKEALENDQKAHQALINSLSDLAQTQDVLENMRYRLRQSRPSERIPSPGLPNHPRPPASSHTPSPSRLSQIKELPHANSVQVLPPGLKTESSPNEDQWPFASNSNDTPQVPQRRLRVQSSQNSTGGMASSSNTSDRSKATQSPSKVHCSSAPPLQVSHQRKSRKVKKPTH